MERDAGDIAYLRYHSVGEGAEQWAALLVVDRRGLPQEFLYSGPLRPTPVQTILYQQSLEGEVRVALARALFRGARSRIAVLVVAPGEAGPAVPQEFSGPVLGLQEEASAWLTEPTPTATQLVRELEATLGILEPLGRSLAALAYVVEYERTRAT